MKQTWYANDAAATGKIADLQVWWDEISHLGPSYGYNANASKTCLVIKEEFRSETDAAFSDTQVKITCEGHPHLGAPLGSPECVQICSREDTRIVKGTKTTIRNCHYPTTRRLCQESSKELKLLSAIATTQPNAAFAAYSPMVIPHPHCPIYQRPSQSAR